MTKEELDQEFLTAKEEKRDLERSLAALHSKRERYRDYLGYLADCLDRKFNHDGLNSGAVSYPDLKKYPSREEINDLLIELEKTNKRLRSAKHRLERFL